MHTVLAALKFVGMLVLAGAAFYGVAVFAKWRNGGEWPWKS